MGFVYYVILNIHDCKVRGPMVTFKWHDMGWGSVIVLIYDINMRDRG